MGAGPTLRRISWSGPPPRVGRYRPPDLGGGGVTEGILGAWLAVLGYGASVLLLARAVTGVRRRRGLAAAAAAAGTALLTVLAMMAMVVLSSALDPLWRAGARPANPPPPAPTDPPPGAAGWRRATPGTSEEPDPAPAPDPAVSPVSGPGAGDG